MSAAFCAIQAPMFQQQQSIAMGDGRPPETDVGGDTDVIKSGTTLRQNEIGVDQNSESDIPDDEVVAVVESPKRSGLTESGKINLRSYLASQMKGTPEGLSPLIDTKTTHSKETLSSPLGEEVVSKMPSVDYRAKLSNMVMHYFVVSNIKSVVRYETSSHVRNKVSYFRSAVSFIPFDMTCQGLVASSKRIAECLAAQALLQTEHFIALEECMLANAETQETGRLRPKRFDYKGKLMAMLFKALPDCYNVRRNTDLFNTVAVDGISSFRSLCTIRELNLTVQGKYAASKKDAEQSAARMMIFHEALGPFRRKANLKLEDLPPDDGDDEFAAHAFSTPLKAKLHELLSQLFSPRLLRDYLVYSHVKCGSGYRCQLRIIPLALNVEGDEEKTIEQAESSAEKMALNTSLLRALADYYYPE